MSYVYVDHSGKCLKYQNKCYMFEKKKNYADSA